MEISTFGAVSGLFIAIALIVFRVAPAYSLMAGAFLGGIIGGFDPKSTIDVMIFGAKEIVPATMRILSAGVLAGVLIESGAAVRIARSVTQLFGEKNAMFALALATLLLTSVGVFIDIAVITVSPIALAVAQNAGCSRFTALFAMIGGGKAGNIISPNPNTISAAKIFDLELTDLMAANIVPALFGLAATVWIARMLHRNDLKNQKTESENRSDQLSESSDALLLPPFWASVLGPFVAILLLAFRPISRFFNLDLFEIDPMLALPIGGIVGCLAMGKARYLNEYMTAGLQRMIGVAILLLGTGTIAGVIQSSSLASDLVYLIEQIGLPAFMLAPISGILMGAATASTTAGTTVASKTFCTPLLDAGVPALGAAAMIHSGATVLDHLPHGSFFHATGGAMGLKFGERLRLIPFESAIGLVLTIVSTLIYGFLLR